MPYCSIVIANNETTDKEDKNYIITANLQIYTNLRINMESKIVINLYIRGYNLL
jgi:hypothetical protein